MSTEISLEESAMGMASRIVASLWSFVVVASFIAGYESTYSAGVNWVRKNEHAAVYVTIMPQTVIDNSKKYIVREIHAHIYPDCVGTPTDTNLVEFVPATEWRYLFGGLLEPITVCDNGYEVSRPINPLHKRSVDIFDLLIEDADKVDFKSRAATMQQIHARHWRDDPEPHILLPRPDPRRVTAR